MTDYRLTDIHAHRRCFPTDVQTVGGTKSKGLRVREEHHDAPGDDGSDATPRRHYRHGETARGRRLRAAAERGHRGVRRDVTRRIIVITLYFTF